jgi:hypothetical protein
MLSKARSFCIAGALIAGALGGASPASANWTTNGSATGTAFTASSGTAKLTVTPVGAAAQGITCTTSSATGKLFGPSLASGNGIASVTPAFGGTCLVVGQTAAVKCGTSNLNGTSYNPVSNLTSGTTTGISCVIAKTSGACGNATTFTGGGITVTGSVTASYGNTTQQMTINQAGQSLAASWNSTGCLQGTGTGTASGQLLNATGSTPGGPCGGGTTGEMVYSVTSAFKPQITN